jgi:hypothetical protein
VDEQTWRRWQRASAEELQEARENGELSEEDYREIVRKRQPSTANMVLTVVLVTVGLVMIGALIFCGGCALMLMRPFQ